MLKNTITDLLFTYAVDKLAARPWVVRRGH